MKELKDYLHLYLGCNVKVSVGQPMDFLCGMNVNTSYVKLLKNDSVLINHVKPILRPLSSMTDEEEKEAYKIRGENAFSEFEGETIRYLLSKHFDLFGLIEAGLAIDKTTLK